MNFTDWLVNIALVAVVLRQIRWNKIDLRFVLVPLALVGVAVASYLKTVPTAGNDLVLIVGLICVGITFGSLSAWATSIRSEHGVASARARALSVLLWIVGIGSRMAFVLYATHGGQPAITRFSIAHHLTGNAWTAALVLMALAEVLTRVGVLVARGLRANAVDRRGSGTPAAPAPARIAA